MQLTTLLSILFSLLILSTVFDSGEYNIVYIVNLTGIEYINDLHWSMQEVGDWQSLCRNLHLDTADMNRIKNT